jgi:hypothetical protein
MGIIHSLETCERLPDVWERWQANDPVKMVEDRVSSRRCAHSGCSTLIVAAATNISCSLERACWLAN